LFLVTIGSNGQGPDHGRPGPGNHNGIAGACSHWVQLIGDYQSEASRSDDMLAACYRRATSPLPAPPPTCASPAGGRRRQLRMIGQHGSGPALSGPAVILISPFPTESTAFTRIVLASAAESAPTWVLLEHRIRKELRSLLLPMTIPAMIRTMRKNVDTTAELDADAMSLPASSPEAHNVQSATKESQRKVNPRSTNKSNQGGPNASMLQ
jgi:hypothetical protein